MTKARRQIGLLFLDLVFPAACSGCGRVDSAWCWRCQQELDAVLVTPLFRSETLVSTAIHDGILQKAIHGLKYDHLPQLAEPLGLRLALLLNAVPWSPDLLVPIPSHTDRLNARGYNQAQLLAEALAEQTGLPCVPPAARRIRETRSQVGLNQRERQANVADAFEADSRLVDGKTVVLVDDVLTTGATLNACADVIRRAGAKQVYGLTVTTASL